MFTFKNSKLKYYFSALAGILVVFFGLAGFTDINAALSKVWLTQEPLQKAEVLIILGGGIDSKTGKLSFKSQERVLSGAQLFQQGYAPAIIVAGGKVGKNPFAEAPAMAELLQKNGVPAEAIIQENQSENTWENAQNALAIAKLRRFQKIIVLTSDFHTYRACKFFRQLGGEVICRAADRDVINQKTFVRRLLSTKVLLREYAANCYYWLKGRL
ncbi:YdcF family protein [Candidatus Parcubacteria bacterium]|jgi:uncharacterized SAM-binding protein YcdF (DUF218 family)|nr:MAG: YdcF family protein [Candidatus Parcubacteria bacterium]